VVKNIGKWVGLLPLLLAITEQATAEETSIFEPAIERQEVTVAAVDTENFEIGLTTGIFQVANFGSSASYGLRAAYHLTEDYFIEASYRTSTVSDDAFRRFGLPVFPSPEEDLKNYSFSIGMNLLPGEIFIGRNHAFTSAFYLLAGVGSTEFVGDDRFTVDVAAGLGVLATDWLRLQLEARDHIWESDLLGKEEMTHNFEVSLGLSLFF